MVQLFTYVIYLSGISGIVGADMSSGITKSVYDVLLLVTIILNIVALICICTIKKEKVVLLQEY